ncbi:MAG: AAA family ATPase [Elusimicrobiaceae bacterium]|nr:AAA family ATPase [Elusimicrobiaceae bacterium]
MKKLSEVSVLAWNIAGAEAISAKFDTIRREHLFVSLTEIEKLLSLTAAKLNFSDAQVRRAADEYADISGIFEKLKLDPRKLRRTVRAAMGEGKTGALSGNIRRSAECKEIFQQAEALADSREQVSSLDLLAALMGSPGKIISDALSDYGVEPSRMLSATNEARLGKKQAQGGAQKSGAEAAPAEQARPEAAAPKARDNERFMPPALRSDKENAAPAAEKQNPGSDRFKPPLPEPDHLAEELFGPRREPARMDNSPYAPPLPARGPAGEKPKIIVRGASGYGDEYVPPKHADKILKIGRNLVRRASEKMLLPAVQREKEVKAVFDILDRNAKMPLLIGEDGVGKSVLIHTLAMRVWDNTAPAMMKGANIIEFSTGELLSAADGDPAEFFKSILKEAEKHPSVYLYVTDLHELLKRADSLSILLKDFVMDRGVHVIGGTTPKGFKEDIEPEKKFAVYFEPVDVKEPDQAAVLEILRANKTGLEIKSGGRLTDRALLAAYTLSTRFGLPGFMPRKALGLIRAVCDRAREGDTPQLRERFAETARKFGLEQEPGINELWVCQTVAEQVNSRLEAVAAELNGRSPARMENLSRNIKGTIVGQNEAVELVAARIAKSSAFAGHKTDKPLVFYFVGPRGVGKTELARRMAVSLIGNDEDMYVFDMSKYSREESLRRIFGSSDTEGRLELAVKESPFGLVLFENADKTLPMFYNLLASFIEEVGSRGVELRNIIFVIASGLFFEVTDIAKYPSDKEIVKSVMDRIPTVIQHHISDVVPFRPLSVQSANLILLKWIDEARTTMQKEHGVYIQMGREVERALVRTGLSLESGTYRLRMVFDQIVMQPLQRVISAGVVVKHKQWVFILSDDHVVLMPKKDSETKA